VAVYYGYLVILYRVVRFHYRPISNPGTNDKPNKRRAPGKKHVNCAATPMRQLTVVYGNFSGWEPLGCGAHLLHSPFAEIATKLCVEAENVKRSTQCSSEEESCSCPSELRASATPTDTLKKRLLQPPDKPSDTKGFKTPIRIDVRKGVMKFIGTGRLLHSRRGI
jgi:hypothetical protein